MNMGPQSERDFPDVVRPQIPGTNQLGHQVGYWIGRRGSPCSEVLRVAACAGPGAGKNVVKDARVRESIFRVALHDEDEAVFRGPPQRMSLEELQQPGKLVAGDSLEKLFPAGEVMINGH